MAKAKPRAGELTTANYGWTKPTVGGSDDQWGGYINADLDGIDSVVHGIQTSIPTVPAASTTLPIMDGTAAIGASGKWADGAHVHPTDTTRYAASNPSGYQTAAQVTASLASYLPLAGGVLTGALTPSATAGLVGATSGNNANAGSIGEVISSVVTTPVTLTSGTPANVASISLTAGDWDVQGEVWVAVGTGGASQVASAIGSTSATLPANSTASSRSALSTTFSASLNALMPLRPCRASLAATTTYYLITQAVFASGTTTATGNIWARRAR